MAKQTFTTGQVLTAAQMTSLQQTAMSGGSTSAKTISYVLVAADAGTMVIMNSASPTTITVNTALFAAGDTVNIQNIGAGVCTVTTGTATVNTAGSLALNQYEGGVLYFTSTSAATFFDYVQSAAAGGKVLQVVSTAKTDTFTQSGGGFADVTGLSVSITPTLASSKILVLVSLSASAAVAGNSSAARLVRAGTDIFIGDTASARTRVTIAILQGETQYPYSNHISFLDSPATTSSTTYKIQVIGLPSGGSTFVNRGQTDTDSATFTRSASSITVMEIGA